MVWSKKLVWNQLNSTEWNYRNTKPNYVLTLEEFVNGWLLPLRGHALCYLIFELQKLGKVKDSSCQTSVEEDWLTSFRRFFPFWIANSHFIIAKMKLNFGILLHKAFCYIELPLPLYSNDFMIQSYISTRILGWEQQIAEEGNETAARQQLDLLGLGAQWDWISR